MIINLFVAPLITVGGFMIAEVARLLHENKVKLPFGYITNSVQEEGLRGAEMIKTNPNVTIVTDVCHDSTTL
jgi:putative aminopeptidase FrvX